MNSADFQAPEAGRLIHTRDGYDAFVPAPLPPALVYDPPLVLALSRADAALGELVGVGRTLPNPTLLIAPTIRREALLSSRIEGTRTELADLLRDEINEDTGGRDDPDLREVRNYVAALEYGVARLRTLPLSLRLARELHERLLAGVRGERMRPGEFRREQNWIGPAGSTLPTAIYVPPPPAEMHDALDRWERFLHQRDILPDLIHCALMHEQFEAIHPFLDGNGRVGRLLITLFLIDRGRLTQPLLSLSAYLEAHRQDYYDLLQRVRTRGDWTSWLLFFLAGVTETAQVSIHQAGQLMDLRETSRSRIRDHARALALLDALFINPYVTVAHAARLLDVSLPTARQAMRILQTHGLLDEISGRAWRRLYVATPIMRILDAPEPTL